MAGLTAYAIKLLVQFKHRFTELRLSVWIVLQDAMLQEFSWSTHLQWGEKNMRTPPGQSDSVADFRSNINTMLQQTLIY